MSTSRLPMGCALAWEVHQKLSSPAAQRLGLQRVVLESMDLTLTQADADRLISQLDAIEDGIEEARKHLAKPKE